MHHRRLLVSTAAFVFALTTCTSPGPTPRHEVANRGAELFLHHCAVCHGVEGDADTVVADLLRPRPTAFSMGRFKLASTSNGMPSEEDLVETLRRGMPGSTMMSWAWMPDADLQALAHEVRALAVAGRARSMLRTAAIGGRPLTEEQALAAAEMQLLPDATVDVGQPAPIDEANLAEGRRLYSLHCQNCHGADGRGLPEHGGPADGWLAPRDFTAGYLRGSATFRDLAHRIRAGMPGAHMPPTRLSADETAALVSYVQGLIPEAARDHHVQWRRSIRVARVGTLPDSADAQAMARVEAVRLPLVPLWWRPEASSEVWLRAVHDGDTLMLQLEWADATDDERVHPGRMLGDGVAVQFAHSVDPPLFAMGSADRPVNVWRWQTFDAKETAGMMDLLGSPHSGLDVPIGGMHPTPRSESIELGGIPSVTAATSSGLPLDATARWQAGSWVVTFRRGLRARNEREIDFQTQQPTLFALAAWNGSIDSHPGSKAITTWHVLDLQP